MTHPITPPPELVKEWVNNHYRGKVHRDLGGVELSIADQAAQWGADHELEACCQALYTSQELRDWLRAARRPKPPTLKEQALNDLDDIPTHDDEGRQVVDLSNIRRALEALPE